MIINGNGQQIQVCKLLLLNTKNFACLNWHVARHLTKTIEISPQKCANLTQKTLWGVGNSVFIIIFRSLQEITVRDTLKTVERVKGPKFHSIRF